MSRNGSGTYTLPAGNPVVTGTTIGSTWANNTLADIQNALTGSIASDGQTTITGPLKGTNGTVSFAGVGQTRIPVGTTAQRAATPLDGMIRYNTDIQQYEGYKNGAWSIFGNGAGGTLFSDTVTATQGQTVINTPTGFVQGGDNLSVYVNGSRQIYNVNYTETSTTQITFTNGLNVGDLVNYTIGASTSLSVNASSVLYNEGSTNAVNRNVEQKLQETVSVKDFGAVGDGVVDDTDAINNAIASGSKQIYFPSGTYKVTSALVITGNYINLTGDGASTNLNFSTLASGYAISFGDGTTQASGCNMSNILLTGGGGANGLRLYGGTGGAGTVACNFTNVFVSSFAVNLTTNRCWTNQFTNCRFVTSTGISAIIGAASNNNLFDRCSFNIATQSLEVTNSEGNQFNSCEFAELTGATAAAISLSQSQIVLINPYFENITSSVIASVGINAESAIKSSLIIEGGQCNVTSPLLKINSNLALIRVTGINCVTNDLSYYDTGLNNGSLYAQVYPSEITTNSNPNTLSQLNSVTPVFYGNQNPPPYTAGGGVTFATYRDWVTMTTTTVVGRGINLSNGGAVIGRPYTIVLAICGTAGNAEIKGAGSTTIGISGYQTANNEFQILYIPVWASAVDIQLTLANLNDSLQIKFAALLQGHKFPRFDIYRAPLNILSTAAPTVGNWLLGDIVYNSAPSVGQPKGWVCTVAGGPGTWVSMGNL